MYTCDQGRELLWDLLYDLLDAEQSQALRDHLADCPACRAALDRALAGRHILSRAARLDDIPPFQVPELDSPNGREEAPAPVPATLPLRRPSFRRPWVAAAAVLLAVGLTYGLHRYEVAHLEAAATAADQRVAQIEHDRKALQNEEQQKESLLAADLRKQQFVVGVLGPSDFRPGVATAYHVQVHDLDGRPTTADVDVRLLDHRGKALAEVKHLHIAGDVLVKLPTVDGKASPDAARLVVVARHDSDRQEIEHGLDAAAPSYLSHLAMDRYVYRPGDVIFFRSVTLDRVTLRPTKRAVALKYTLLDARGKVVPGYQISGPTRDGGIGGGEFPVEPLKLPDGEYTLRLELPSENAPPVQRKLLVHRAGGPDVKVAAEEGPVDALPAVQFFPEGGNLVAGVANRVYVRVQTAAGQPADLDGRVVDSQGREMVRVQTVPAATPTPNLALGVFTFTPRAGEEYRLQVTNPAGVKGPLPLPRVEESTLALSVPSGATRPGEPIRVTIAHGDSVERDLVVGVTCRGRLVAEEAVTARKGTTEVRLNPTPDAGGVLRVTVYESRQGCLVPRAERLVYRVPAERLVLSAQPDKNRYQAGEPVKLAVRAADEHGKPSGAWLLVAVVEARAARGVGGLTETGVAAQFYLTSQLERPEDLEDADVLLRDTPQAAQALDLFLGTQGWRHFTGPEQPTAAVAVAAGKGAPVERGAASILRFDNAAAAQAKFEHARVARIAPLELAFCARDGELKEEEARCSLQRAEADSALHTYRARVRDYGQIGLGLLTLLLFVVGCAAFVVAVLRSVHGRRGSASAFGTALAALLLCVVSFFTFSGQSTEIVQPIGPSVVTGREKEPQGGSPGRQEIRPFQVADAARDAANRDAQVREGLRQLQARAAEIDQQRNAAGVKGVGPEKRFATAMKEFEKRLTPHPASPPVLPAIPVRPDAGGPDSLFLQQYPVNRREYPPLPSDFRETVFWHPTLVTGADGKVAVPELVLSNGGPAFRVLIYGHSATGRLGMYTGTLESTPRK